MTNTITEEVTPTPEPIKVQICPDCPNGYEISEEVEALGLDIEVVRCETHAIIEFYFGD